MRIAINGFGRIGRTFLRVALQQPSLQVVAINDLADAETLAHLFKYDSVHGVFAGSVEVENNHLLINGQAIQIFSEKNPENLPWEELAIDLVIESTGQFTTQKLANAHLLAGAKQVLISAPSADKSIPTVVLGVNEKKIDLQTN